MEAWDHWIAFVLLGWIGGKMALSGLRALRNRESCACPSVDPTAGRNLVVLGVATSIDALAVGLSLAILGTPIWADAAIIGIVCAVCSGCICGERKGCSSGWGFVALRGCWGRGMACPLRGDFYRPAGAGAFSLFLIWAACAAGVTPPLAGAPPRP